MLPRRVSPANATACRRFPFAGDEPASDGHRTIGASATRRKDEWPSHGRQVPGKQLPHALPIANPAARKGARTQVPASGDASSHPARWPSHKKQQMADGDCRHGTGQRVPCAARRCGTTSPPSARPSARGSPVREMSRRRPSGATCDRSGQMASGPHRAGRSSPDHCIDKQARRKTANVNVAYHRSRTRASPG